MEKHNFVYCPNPNCVAKLSSDWRCHEVNKTEEGIAIYKCPYCATKWTADNILANAIEIPKEAVERKSRVVVIDEGKVIGEFQAEQAFKVRIRGKGRFFLHVPTKMICRSQKAFLVPPGLSTENFLKGLE